MRLPVTTEPIMTSIEMALRQMRTIREQLSIVCGVDRHWKSTFLNSENQSSSSNQSNTRNQGSNSEQEGCPSSQEDVPEWFTGLGSSSLDFFFDSFTKCLFRGRALCSLVERLSANSSEVQVLFSSQALYVWEARAESLLEEWETSMVGLRLIKMSVWLSEAIEIMSFLSDECLNELCMGVFDALIDSFGVESEWEQYIPAPLLWQDCSLAVTWFAWADRKKNGKIRVGKELERVFDSVPTVEEDFTLSQMEEEDF